VQMDERRKAVTMSFELAIAAVACAFLFSLAAFAGGGQAVAPAPANDAGVAVGAQYDSTHVYVASGDLDAFVASFIATFGGTAAKLGVTNILPVPSSTEFQPVTTPVGMLSVFAFQTPIAFPFGQERTGYLVTDMDQAVKEARADGAEVIVAPFKDPIGLDAVIQWPGGVKMQLYWHLTPPNYAPLATIPDNRVYVSSDVADTFVADFVRFSHGTVLSDDKSADAGEIGRPGETYRRIRITSAFGNMQALVTDGHLPYPFGHEIMGYQVSDLGATLAKATAFGAKILSAPYASSDRTSAVVEFPGGYIAEIHSLTAH
jgi:predicted enzyme related to lactoylglutathione lyase